MSWTRAVESVLLPPAGLIWLGLAGLLLYRTRWRRSGIVCVAVAVLGLYGLSMPLVVGGMLKTLDRYPPIDLVQPPAAQAIVVLGAGLTRNAREYGGDQVSPMGLERLRYGAWLHRQLGLPLLVTGYSGEQMARTLEGSFELSVRWIEGEARNTYQSAVLVRELLGPEGLTRVLLVSHFWHLPRSVAVFRQAGLEPVPAPMGFADPGELDQGLGAIVPRSGSLLISNAVFHEWLGRLWYGLRYGT